MRKLGLAIGLLLLATGGRAVAADVLAPPQWSSDQVRAARPISPEPALVIDIDRMVTRGAAPATRTHERVTLAQSFSFAETGDVSLLYDHTLCRWLAWKPSAATFSSDSCYAPVAFRTFEAVNRKQMAALLTKLQPPQAPPLPYWDEAELGYQAAPSDPLVRTDAADEHDYRLGDVVVVKLHTGPEALSAAEMHAVVRYLAGGTPLHPQVRRDLQASQRLPDIIEIVGQEAGQPYTQKIAIKLVGRSAATYPLPAGLRSEVRAEAEAGTSPRSAGLTAALELTDGGSAPAEPSFDDLVTTFKAAADDHKDLPALLTFIELTQLYAPMLQEPAEQQALSDIKSRIASVLQDPGAAQFWAASEAAGAKSGADRQPIASYLATTDTDDLPFGTFRYVTFANLVRSAGDTSNWDPAIFKQMPALADGVWRHIARYPWSANAYKDAGDIYITEFRMSDAWLAYDLGRSVDKHWQGGVMGSLSDFEDDMRTRQPDFF